MQYSVLPSESSRLGECPIWCDRSHRLWWVDVLTPTLWSFDPATGRCRKHDVSARRIGSIALRREEGLILACDNGLFKYDADTAEQIFLVDPEPNMPAHRKNDGRADWAGNFWVGTLREEDYASVGSVYRISPSLKVSVEATGLAIPNALAFDQDRRRMYFGDTRAYAIWSRDYDPVNGCSGADELFASTVAPARPDGSCIDVEGHVWNAEYAGSRLVRFSPDGGVSATVPLPVTYPTCCCFGGEKFDKLYVTSAYEPLTAEERKQESLAGRVLVLDVGVTGRPEYRVGF